MIPFIKTIYVFALIFFLPFHLFPQYQNYRFENINSDDGLSENSVVVIYQDSRQFLWFGTFNGLNRYDGYSFKIYKSDIEDSTTISGSTISSICEDRLGNLWIGSLGGGLNKYDRNAESFTRYEHKSEFLNSLSDDRVKSVIVDSNGDLWVGTENGLNKLNYTTGKFLHYFHVPKNQNSISSNFISSVCEDLNGNLWIGTWSGLDKFDKKSKTFTHFYKNPRSQSGLVSNQINKVYCNKENEIWIGTDEGLQKYVEKKNRFVNYKSNIEDVMSLSSKVITDILEDNQGNLFVATYGGGLNFLDKKAEKFIQYKNNAFDKFSINNDVLFSLCEDKSGILWIGTAGSGISKLDRHKSHFNNFYHEPDNLNSLSNNKVFSIYEDRGGIIWIGTFGGGLNRYDPNSDINNFVHYKHNPDDPYSLADDKIICISEDRAGVLWIGTEGGLDKFIKISKRFIHYNKDNSKGLKNNSVFDIYETRTGEFWVGTYDGFYLFNRKKNEFKCFQHNPSDSNSIVNNFVRKIYEDHSGVLWICTDKGLDRYDIKSKKFYHLKTDPGVAFNLNDFPILTILESKSGDIWIGTTVGLFKLLRNNKDGLPDNNIQGIIEDDENNLWISTNKGISKFNFEKWTFKNLNMNNGLPSDEFYVNSIQKRKETGELLFGGVKGFTVFHPNDIKDDLYIAPVVFTDFRVSNSAVPIGKVIDGNIILKKSITENNQITLSHKNSIISFEFALLHYAAPSGNSYAYKMEGSESKWNYIGNKRNATYTFLPPGEYTLNVKASNSSGVWNEKGASLKIIVIPPMWQTWWFRISAGLVLLFIASIIFKIRVSSIEKSRNQLEKLNEQLSEEIKERHQKEIELRKAKDEAEKSDKLKTEFLAQMSHEIRTPINAILSFTSLLKEEVSDKIPEDLGQSFNIIDGAGNRLIRTIDLILNMSQLQTDTYEFNYKEFDIYDRILEGLLLQYKKFANDKNLELLIKKKIDNPVIYADEYTVGQIFENLLNNSIKYTNKGKIEIKINRNGKNELEVEVSDTGVGISEEFLPNLFKPFTQEEGGYTRRFEGNGLGLALVKKYVELNGAKIEVRSKKGKGTTFKIKFNPILKDF